MVLAGGVAVQIAAAKQQHWQRVAHKLHMKQPHPVCALLCSALPVAVRLCHPSVSELATSHSAASPLPSSPPLSLLPLTFHRMLRVWLNLNKFNKHKLFAAAAALSLLATLFARWQTNGGAYLPHLPSRHSACSWLKAARCCHTRRKRGRERESCKSKLQAAFAWNFN